MHEGTFIDNIPLISIILKQNKLVETIAFVLDTGFTGNLQVTPEIASYLGLNPMGISFVQMANGQTISVPIAAISATIEGITKTVPVLISNGMPLAGIGLFSQFGYTVIVDCKKKEVYLKNN